MKRSPLKRRTALRTRSTLRRAARSGRADPTRRLATYCELGLAGCGHRASHRHHRKRRSQGGDDSAANTLDLCAACHEWIHAHPAISYERGYLIRSSPNP